MTLTGHCLFDLDILLRESIWNADLQKHAVKRAVHGGLYQADSVFCGVVIGKGDLQARLYDKPYEIKTKSKKTWMYDVWGLQDVPEGARIVRVEFQLRREVLMELGIDTIWNLIRSLKETMGVLHGSLAEVPGSPGTASHTAKDAAVVEDCAIRLSRRSTGMPINSGENR